MFETENYRFKFERVNVCKRSGRYDTLCSVYVNDGFTSSEVIPLFTGLAVLHPNDRPDKVIGKKMALLRAMKKQKTGQYRTSFWTKAKRTEVWQAFWSWVSSWSKGKCVACNSDNSRNGVCLICLKEIEQRCLAEIEQPTAKSKKRKGIIRTQIGNQNDSQHQA